MESVLRQHHDETVVGETGLPVSQRCIHAGVGDRLRPAGGVEPERMMDRIDAQQATGGGTSLGDPVGVGDHHGVTCDRVRARDSMAEGWATITAGWPAFT